MEIKLLSESLQNADVIRSKMEDQRSREIFDIYLDDILSGGRIILDEFGEKLLSCVESFSQLEFFNKGTGTIDILPDMESCIIWGIGIDGIHNIKLCKKKGIKVSCVDSDVLKVGHSILIDGEEFIILSPDILKESSENVLVSSTRYLDEIEKSLAKMGIAGERVIKTGRMNALNSNQYFDVFTPSDSEIFLDVGGYDGQSSVKFCEWCGNKRYKEIHIMEPEADNYEMCRATINKYKMKNVFLHKMGAYNETRELSFASGIGACSGVEMRSGGKESTVAVVKIDEMLEGKKCTFIKMDIEGAEVNALFGAVETIKKYKPKLAICIYHRFSDFLIIPNILLSLVPEYRFYLRHY